MPGRRPRNSFREEASHSPAEGERGEEQGGGGGEAEIVMVA